MGVLTKRADRYVAKMLRQWRTVERRHPAEVAAVEQALGDRLNERRRSLRQHSTKGK